MIFANSIMCVQYFCELNTIYLSVLYMMLNEEFFEQSNRIAIGIPKGTKTAFKCVVNRSKFIRIFTQIA